MAEKLGEAFLELTARDGKLKAALAGAERKSQTAVSGIGAQFKKLGGDITGSIVKGMAVFTLLQKGLGELRAGIDRAMKLEGLERAFESLTGSGAKTTTMLNAMNAAFKGTVDQVTALEIANTALLLGVVKNEKEMAFLAMAGRRLGKAVGKDTAFGFNSLTIGIGRQSKLMLDNLGIIVDTNKAYEDFAALLGKTAAELTDAEKKQAFMNATMDATREKLSGLGADIEDAGEKWLRFKATFTDVFTALGSGIVAVAEGIHDFVRDSIKGIKNIFTSSTIVIAATNESMKALIDTEKKLLHRIDERDKKAFRFLRVVIDTEQAYKDVAAQLGKTVEQLAFVEKQQALHIARARKLLELATERARREVEVTKEIERQRELSRKQHASERKAWEEQEKVRERLFITELRLRGETLKATLRAIELERKALQAAAITAEQKTQIDRWARLAAVDARKKAAEEEVRIEEKKERELEKLRAKEAREIKKLRRKALREEEEEKSRMQRIDRRIRDWDKKTATLTVSWLRKIGREREADILALEAWRKAEVEAAGGSVERLKLIDALYRASFADINKMKAETKRPEWIGAEQLWKRAVTITKGAEPKPAIQVMATPEDKKMLEEAKKQTEELKKLNAKEGAIAVLK